MYSEIELIIDANRIFWFHKQESNKIPWCIVHERQFAKTAFVIVSANLKE